MIVSLNSLSLKTCFSFDFVHVKFCPNRMNGSDCQSPPHLSPSETKQFIELLVWSCKIFIGKIFTLPFLSFLMSSISGCAVPSLFLPSPSPWFHPIFCRSAIPIPPFRGAQDFNCSCTQQAIIKYNHSKIKKDKINWF